MFWISASYLADKPLAYNSEIFFAISPKAISGLSSLILGIAILQKALYLVITFLTFFIFSAAGATFSGDFLEFFLTGSGTISGTLAAAGLFLTFEAFDSFSNLSMSSFAFCSYYVFFAFVSFYQDFLTISSFSFFEQL